MDIFCKKWIIFSWCLSCLYTVLVPYGAKKILFVGKAEKDAGAGPLKIFWLLTWLEYLCFSSLQPAPRYLKHFTTMKYSSSGGFTYVTQLMAGNDFLNRIFLTILSPHIPFQSGKKVVAIESTWWRWRKKLKKVTKDCRWRVRVRDRFQKKTWTCVWSCARRRGRWWGRGWGRWRMVRLVGTQVSKSQTNF